MPFTAVTQQRARGDSDYSRLVGDEAADRVRAKVATAAKVGVSLRDLDKALWQKDVNRANRSPCK